jgi:hypothetical protein
MLIPTVGARRADCTLPRGLQPGAMPAGKEGLLFLKHGLPLLPDSDHLTACTEHAGRRGGHWPSSSEIGSAMLDQEQVGRYDGTVKR